MYIILVFMNRFLLPLMHIRLDIYNAFQFLQLELCMKGIYYYQMAFYFFDI
jgi:hypothetical protein